MALVVVDKSKPPVDIEAKPGLVGGVEYKGNHRVAIKFENRKTVVPQLRDEYRTYRMLNEFMRGQEQVLHQTSLKDGALLYGGVPQAYYFGQDSIYNCLVMDLLGPSLEELFDQCGRKFTVPTVCQIAIQMLYLIEMIHNCGLIYRDIKPDNFLIGADNLIYIVDFGMAKAYLDPRTLQHIPYRERKSLSGTARYMSINTHLGREQSRRDDLEALGHVFFYFLRGALPWQGLTAASNKEKYEKIGLKKQDISMSELCNGFPDEFCKYLQYARGLKFDATPDYEMLRGMMSDVMTRYGPVSHFKYDWAQYRSTWEPELLSKVSESELKRLKLDALNSASSSPLSPCSLNSTTSTAPPFSFDSYRNKQQQAPHRSVAIFNDSNNCSIYNTVSSGNKPQANRDNNMNNHNSRFSHEFHPAQQPQQEKNHCRRGNWLKRLFCL